MSKLNRKTIKYGFYSGVFYASGMALFDYLEYKDFNLWKFIFGFLFFGFLFFGFFTGLLIRPSLRKKFSEEKR
ncbi:hypothetical protein FT993_09820 [Mesonia sp. HuA40]|nr:hypothetical protein FT993_09820 [Mesonia sp. HuA40]